MSVTILAGDVLEKLATLEDESAHCVVTSPPYWGLRDYGVEGQLGLEPTVEEYIEKMVAVFREVRRVLRKDGTLWLNMGDCYAAGKMRDDQVCRNGGKRNANTQSVLRVPGLKPKDLVGQPWRLAFALQADGWWLRSDIIWSKPNPMPESCRDRPTKAHEYVFMLTKSGTPTFWTHRDGPGRHRKPKPDWRWIDQAAGYLDAHKAELWGTSLPASFKAIGFSANLSRARKLIELRDEPDGWKMEPFPDIPEGQPPCSHTKRWRRINLWQAHDYFWDQEAVREAHATPKEHRQSKAGRRCMRGQESIRPRGNLEVCDDAATRYYSDGGRNIRSVWTMVAARSAGRRGSG
jgi:hypothetical protein